MEMWVLFLASCWIYCQSDRKGAEEAETENAIYGMHFIDISYKYFEIRGVTSFVSGKYHINICISILYLYLHNISICYIYMLYLVEAGLALSPSSFSFS